jgi:hypothetical protein
MLYILTTGQSWYESLGYKSPDTDRNKAQNQIIIENTKIQDVLEKFQFFVEKNKKYVSLITNNYKSSLDDQINFCFSELSQSRSWREMSLQEFFLKVKEFLIEIDEEGGECDSPQLLLILRMLQVFIDYIETELISYQDMDLQKDIKRVNVGGTKRKRRHRRRCKSAKKKLYH